MKPICAPCRRFFRPKKTGFEFIEGMPTENGAPPGTSAPEKWKPYKIWMGDLWECQGCDTTIVNGMGLAPIAVQHHPFFGDRLSGLGPDALQVNDC